MQRTIITPTDSIIQLIIPANYIGRQVEVLVHALDESICSDQKDTKKNSRPSDFAGSISKERATELLRQLESGRNEWERDI